MTRHPGNTLRFIALFVALGAVLIPTPSQSQAGCGLDCAAIYKAAVSWFAGQHAVAANQIVIDTSASGQRFTATRDREVPSAVIRDLVQATGSRSGVSVQVLECADSRLLERVRPNEGGVQNKARCFLKQGRALVTLFSPALQDGEAELVLSYYHMPEAYVLNGGTYVLTLRSLGQTWVVVRSRVMSLS